MPYKSLNNILAGCVKLAKIKVKLFKEIDMVNRNDNRHFYRMMVNADVKLMINDPEAARVVDGVCRDLSASGMSVETDELIELGTLIRIRLESPNASVPPLVATAKVMRSSQGSAEGYNLGLAFIELN